MFIKPLVSFKRHRHTLSVQKKEEIYVTKKGKNGKDREYNPCLSVLLVTLVLEKFGPSTWSDHLFQDTIIFYQHWVVEGSVFAAFLIARSQQCWKGGAVLAAKPSLNRQEAKKEKQEGEKIKWQRKMTHQEGCATRIPCDMSQVLFKH